MNLPGLLMAIGIGAAIVVGIITMANTALEKSRVTDLITLVAQLRQGTVQAFAGTPQYGTAGTDLVPALDARAVIPDSARVMDGTDPDIWHPFGAEIAVAVDTDVTQFDITINDLPQAACTRLGDSLIGQTTARAGLVSVSVNAVVHNVRTSGAVPATHFTTNCQSAAETDVILTYT